MFSPEKGWACASAVLVGKRTALTSAHNFNEAVATSSKIFSPRTGHSIEIKKADIDKENDIAILTLKGNASELFARIDEETEPLEGLQVFKLRMTSFDPRFGKLELVKGVLKSPSCKIFQRTQTGLIQKPCSLFKMASKPGDSGAGIFTLSGKLLTINNTGHPMKNECSGTRIDVIRRLSI